jgi:hypothetical protein
MEAGQSPEYRQSSTGSWARPISKGAKHMEFMTLLREFVLMTCCWLPFSAPLKMPILTFFNQTPHLISIQRSGIQMYWKNAQSNVLVLLDCCCAGIANNSKGSGVEFVSIASC